jgi:hypothetical protein
MKNEQVQEGENLAREVYEACGRYLNTLTDIYKIFYGEAKLGNEEAPCYKDEFLQRSMKNFRRKLKELKKVYEKIEKTYGKIKDGDRKKFFYYIHKINEISKVITVSLSFDYFIFLTGIIYKNVSNCAEEHHIDSQRSESAIMETGSSLIDAIKKLLSYESEQNEKRKRTIKRNKR